MYNRGALISRTRCESTVRSTQDCFYGIDQSLSLVIPPQLSSVLSIHEPNAWQLEPESSFFVLDLCGFCDRLLTAFGS